MDVTTESKDERPQLPASVNVAESQATPYATPAHLQEQAEMSKRSIRPMQPDFRLFFGSLFDSARQSESTGRFSLLMSNAPSRPLVTPQRAVVNPSPIAPRIGDLIVHSSSPNFTNSSSRTEVRPGPHSGFRSDNSITDADPCTSSDDSVPSSLPELEAVRSEDSEVSMDTDEPLTSSDEDKRHTQTWVNRNRDFLQAPTSESSMSEDDGSQFSDER